MWSRRKGIFTSYIKVLHVGWIVCIHSLLFDLIYLLATDVWGKQAFALTSIASSQS